MHEILLDVNGRHTRIDISIPLIDERICRFSRTRSLSLSVSHAVEDEVDIQSFDQEEQSLQFLCLSEESPGPSMHPPMIEPVDLTHSSTFIHSFIQSFIHSFISSSDKCQRSGKERSISQLTVVALILALTPALH